MRDGCAFCDYQGPSAILERFNHLIGPTGVFVIEPIAPVVPGHVLVIPEKHVLDFTDDPAVTAEVMEAAAQYVKASGLEHVNLIASKGQYATQSVMHLHVHVVPRADGDGLALPWGIRGQGHTLRTPFTPIPSGAPARARG